MAKADNSSAYRQSPRQRQRSPSPEPERWTANNPDWVKEVGWQSSVIYPRDGKNKATVDMQDIQRLDEGEFLNDNLIVFYLRWLEDRLVKDNPELANRIYFHNTFFYERLTKHGKGKLGGINYEAVERWTAKFDLLKYDYIVVPVNETVHWYVAIICNAPKLLRQPLEETTQLDAETGGAHNGPNMVEAEAQSTALPSNSPAKTIPEEVSTEMKDMTLEDRPGEVPGNDAPQDPGTASVPTEDQKDTNMAERDVQPVTFSSNIGSEKPVQAVQHKKGKRKSAPPPRKYDPKEPRIITLDSLGLSHSPTSFSSNIGSEKPVQAVQHKKGKRKSAPPPRKYDPKEPRIITLDSLGLSHSPTCANLKRYLLQEIKAKKNIEIDEPRNLGMTAKNIPQQDNHCDCGLFLLTYIEEFLKRPDGFVHDILQQNEQDFRGWRSASDMRRHIRERLFELQKEQVSEAHALRKEKAKSKQVAKAGDKLASASTSKSASREASKSARNSIGPEGVQSGPKDVDHVPVVEAQTQEEMKIAAQSTNKQALAESEPSKSNSVDLSKEDSRHIPEGRGFIHRTLSRVTSAIFDFSHAEEKESTDSKTSASQPITIEDSQDMDDTPQEALFDVKQVQPIQSRRSLIKESIRGSKTSGPGNSIEVPESPRNESSKKIFFHPHPLPYSSPEQEGVQPSQTTDPHSKNSRRRGNGKTKSTKPIATNGNALGLDGNDLANSDESPESVQLLDAPARPPDKDFVANRQQEEDDQMLLQDPVPRASPPPPEVSYLHSSSPPEVVHQFSARATSRSRGRTTPISPPSVKRPSSRAAENSQRPAKRRKESVVVDLVEDHSPTDISPRDPAEAAMLAAYATSRHRRFS